jgi:hypothetical protein
LSGGVMRKRPCSLCRQAPSGGHDSPPAHFLRLTLFNVVSRGPRFAAHAHALVVAARRRLPSGHRLPPQAPLLTLFARIWVRQRPDRINPPTRRATRSRYESRVTNARRPVRAEPSPGSSTRRY